MSKFFQGTPEAVVKEADKVFKTIMQKPEVGRAIMARILKCQTQADAFLFGYHFGFAACMNEVGNGRLAPVEIQNN